MIFTLHCAGNVVLTMLNPTYESLEFIGESNSAIAHNCSMKYRRLYVPGATFFFHACDLSTTINFRFADGG